jgi:hypothetical protein
MVTEGGWKPKRSLDRESRRAKAAKIAGTAQGRNSTPRQKLLQAIW